MQRGKKVNIQSLLKEMKEYDEETKESLLKFFDFVYNDHKWSYKKDKLPRNKVALYSFIEDLLK